MKRDINQHDQHKNDHYVYALRHVAQRMYMYNQQFRQDGHIHEVKTYKHENMDKIGIQVKYMNHQNLTILAYLIGTNKHSNTNT